MTRHPIDWTPARVSRLRLLRADGKTCIEIATALGISKNAVINQLDKLSMPTGVASRRRVAARVLPSRSADPLPAGHPTTWGAIAGEVTWIGGAT